MIRSPQIPFLLQAQLAQCRQRQGKLINAIPKACAFAPSPSHLSGFKYFTTFVSGAFQMMCHPPFSSDEAYNCIGSRFNDKFSINATPLTAMVTKRSFFGRASWDEENERLLNRRNKSIIMNPKGHGHRILPGNFVMKTNPKTNEERKVILEHELGHFWGMKDVTLTNSKPILSNPSIIPAADAESFPSLKGLNSISGETVDLPEFFTRNNPLKDATAHCTLVAVSCKEFGRKLLPSWTEPFRGALCKGKDGCKYEVVDISINEGRFLRLISSMILFENKRKVPESQHANTLVYFGDAEEMRDVLRMHNIFCGYVFLVDGIGRVRWAGSGEGSKEEVSSIIEFAKELTKTPEQKHSRTRGPQLPGPRRGKRLEKKA